MRFMARTHLYAVYSRVLFEIMWPVLGQNIKQIRQDLILIVQGLATARGQLVWLVSLLKFVLNRKFATVFNFHIVTYFQEKQNME